MSFNSLRPKLITFLGLLVIASGGFSGLFYTQTSYATPVLDFKPGRIIEDSVFTNSQSMTVSDIQLFLNSKTPVCDTQGTQPSEYGGGTRAEWAANASLHPGIGAFYPPFTCLKDYLENGLSTAQIVYNLSQQYQINPQILIVLLQKEQSLVTDTWPSPAQYKTATGYGCLDTSACDSQYFGLTNQLTWSAKMFRSILNNNPNWYSPYSLGNNFVRWSPNSACSGNTVYIENRSTQALYSYTPYQPNQAALNAEYGMGDSCSAYGNRNFYLYFRDWFGYNSGPAAFKTANSSTIYLPVEGYKLTVPYMAAMQDYGISAEAVQTVDQSYVDARPFPPIDSGISNSISHVVKSPLATDEDGAAVYLFSRGARYQFQSMAQFYSFGFKDSDISSLPLSYIFSKPNGGLLSNFVSSPYGSLFEVSSGKKQLFFEYNTYISQNPSDTIARLSYYLVDKIPSGTPITGRPVMIQYPTGGEVNLYQNSQYYSIPNYDVLSCWGLNTSNLSVPTYRLPQADYIGSFIPSSALSCTINDGQNNQLLRGTNRLTLPDGLITTPPQALSIDLKSLISKINLRTNPLSPYVKTPDSSAVWYLNGGLKRVIPSYLAFTLMGLSDPNVDSVSNGFLNSIPDAGIKLADGQLVKTPDSAKVYVISGNQRVGYNSSSAFEAYKNNWSNIEKYSTANLDQYYQDNGSSVSNVLVDKLNGKAFVINSSTCYSLSSTTLSAMGKTMSDITSQQSYDISAFKSINVSTCTTPSSNFIQEPGQSLVYWLDGGQKHALTTYQAMLNKNSGVIPTVMTVDSTFIASIISGQSYAQ